MGHNIFVFVDNFMMDGLLKNPNLNVKDEITVILDHMSEKVNSTRGAAKQ
jgi:hypothetical protein